ncbi:MAG: DUF2293 domain-containing protein [Acidobacteria bacterium]|nr:MAG: DUF2293 domain-containing protein [Acidobacteriota bacterium]
MPTKNEIAVFITSGAASCDECKEELGRGAWIRTLEGRRAACLSCADLDHLVFLPAGSVALTRRSKKYSALWAVVLKWSRARKRYERQGLLVEESALDRAELECLADEDVRARQRARAAELRSTEDEKFIDSFATRVRGLFPNSPPGRESEIASHACKKYSGRVGRSASAKSLESSAVLFAVRAHVRHTETPYDELLFKGIDRSIARHEVQSAVDSVLDRWAGNVRQ